MRPYSNDASFTSQTLFSKRRESSLTTAKLQPPSSRLPSHGEMEYAIGKKPYMLGNSLMAKLISKWIILTLLIVLVFPRLASADDSPITEFTLPTTDSKPGDIVT